MILEISTHGSKLSRKRERFVIQSPNVDTYEISAVKVDGIIISANVSVTTQAMKLCIERQIQLVLTSYTGKPIGRIWSSSSGRQTQIRRQQYLNIKTEFAFTISKKLLLEKIRMQKRLLSDLRHNRKDIHLKMDIFSVISFMDKTIQTIQNTTYTKRFAASFLGLEGSCASLYFKTLSACLPSKYRFNKRSQNPGLDEFNVSLNYLYGIAYSDIERIVIISGLDPNAGFYHVDSYGKPTLVFDLIEPSRSIIDRALMSLFNTKQIQDNCFLRSELLGDIQIHKDGRAQLLDCYKAKCKDQVEKMSWLHCKNITTKLLDLDQKI